MKEDLGKLMLCVCLGGLMLPHGIHKLMNGVAGIERRVVEAGLPALTYGVHLGETVPPLLLLIGFKSRLAGSCNHDI